MFINVKTADEVLQDSIVDAVNKKKAELRVGYETDMQANILYMGSVFEADNYSQDLLTKCLSAGSVPNGFYWKNKVNEKVPMTYEQLKGLSLTILERNQILFDKLSNKKDEIILATQNPVDPVSAINNITW